MQTENLTGQTIGLWKVLHLTARPVNKQGIFYLCECQCISKTLRPVAARDLAKVLRGEGGSHSCGCERIRLAKENMTLHGEASTRNGNKVSRTYKCWQNMKNRVLNPKTESDIKNYGNLYIDTRWVESYLNFKEDMGECPEGLEIDRIDPFKGYYKDNCRWATKLVNARNKKWSRTWLYKNDKLNLTQLTEMSPINLSRGTIQSRLKLHIGDISDEELCRIISIPRYKYKHN